MVTRTYRPIPVSRLASGTELVLPIHEVTGDRPGPVLGVSAAIHGEEAVGTEIVYRFLTSYDLRGLAGRLRVLPVANPFSYAAITRNTPIDMMNLNRVFPGNPDGMLTEQLAHKMAEGFLTGLDYYVDLHAGGAYPTVDYVYIINAEPLSRAFGSRLLYRPKDVPTGTSVSVTRAHNTPSVVVELGGGDVDQAAYVRRGIAGLANILKALRMLPGDPTPPPAQIVLREIATLRPHHGGLLLPEVTTLGGEVAGGQVLGRIVSPYTFEELEILRCPFDRGIMVLSQLTANVVEPGIFGCMIGNLGTAETERIDATS
ncbi:MAG TPA: M14 family metallopeptidase [bacterium]|nr:M14 family metallopeptidase [bacterium]